LFSEVAALPITLTIRDQRDFTAKIFTVTVINRPPEYVSPKTPYVAVTVHLNFQADVVIPAFFDRDGSDSFV
jgi:hypothetical protein